MSIWTVIRFLHVSSAIIWVGGQLTLSLVVRPAAAAVGLEERSELFTEAGRRFGRIALIGLMPLLLSTGLALAFHRGVTFGALARPGYGSTLGAKVAFALVSFGLAAAHGVAATRTGGAARAVGLAAAVVSLIVVALATSLVP